MVGAGSCWIKVILMGIERFVFVCCFALSLRDGVGIFF